MKIDRIQPVAVKPARGRRAPGSQTIVLALVSVAACVMVQYFYLAAGISGALDGRMPDTDDHMRIMQAMRWLDGAGWYDMTVARLNPPYGMLMHWSRLIDLPLAAVVAASQPWLGREIAITAAIIAVPAAVLVAFFLASAWLARPVLGRANGPLLVMLASLPYALMAQFTPGRIDHHAWQLTLAVIMIGALIRLALRPHDRRPAIAAAVAGACGLWIGGDIIPWIALVAAVLAGFWIVDGERWLGAGRTFGVSLLGASVLLLPVALPPGRWFEVACDAFSLVHIGLAGAVALFWLALPRAGSLASTPSGRAALAGLAAAIGLGFLALLFPECRQGPYGGLDGRLQATWLAGVSEAKPLMSLFKGRPELIVLFVATPLMALAVTVARVFKTAGRARRVWLVSAAALVMAFALSAWQIRGLAFAIAFALLPLTWLIITPARRAAGWNRVVAQIGGVLVMGMGVSLFIPIAADLSYSKSFAEVAAGEAPRNCDVKAAAPILGDPQGLGSRPRVIAAFVDHGPEILYRTPHGVLGAPYHRNGEGILDTYGIFTAADPAAARAILQRRQVDLVMLCPAPRTLKTYERPGAPGAPDVTARAASPPGAPGAPDVTARAASPPGAPGAPDVTARAASPPGERTFATRLAAGETPPWLKPISLPAAAGFLLFEVR